MRVYLYIYIIYIYKVLDIFFFLSDFTHQFFVVQIFGGGFK